MNTFTKFSMVIVATSIFAGSAFAATANLSCTTMPQSKWMPLAKINAMIRKEGIKVSSLKVKGNCYRVVGSSANGKLSVIYLDPVTGKIIK